MALSTRPIVLGALALLLVGCAHPRRPGPSGFAGASFPPGVRAPGFDLTADDGRRVSSADLRGRVVVLAFLSSDHRDATLAAQQIRGALDQLGSPEAPVAVLLLAAPSTRRDAGAARRFLGETGLRGRAEHLTSAPARLRAVWRAYGVVLPSAGKRAFLASPTVLLLDRRGFERVGFPLEQLTPEALAHDLSALLAGA